MSVADGNGSAEGAVRDASAAGADGWAGDWADAAFAPPDACAAAASVVDPELRVLTIEELGILRDVRQHAGRIRVTVTPTYTGCPAMDVIRADIVVALRAAGYRDVEVRIALHPAWSTDWITASGRAKLGAAGIVPPGPAAGAGMPDRMRAGGTGAGVRVPLLISVRCPRCASPDTERLSRFGSTACKAVWRCRACGEPFEQLKAL